MSRLFHSQRHAACSVDYPQAARLHVLAASLVLAVAAGSFAIPRADAQSVPSAAETAMHAINLPAAPLGQSLNNLAQQAGVQIIFAGQLTEGKNAPALHGSYTAADALQRLLTGSGLTALARDAKTFTVTNTADAGADGGMLAPVTVRAERSTTTEGSDSYAARAAVIGKTARSLREIPQSVTVITRRRIDDQNLRDLDRVLEQTPGIMVRSWDAQNSTITSRGFDVDDLQFDGVTATTLSYNNAPSSSPDMALYDHVEVLRGSSGLLKGTGNPSAVINLVRKRPTREFKAGVNLSIGSWQSMRAETDISGPLDADGRIRGRLVAAHEDAESYIDIIDHRKSVLYGIAEIDLTPVTMLSLGLRTQEWKGVPWGWGIPSTTTGGSAGLPRSTYLGQRWHTRKADESEAFAQLEHRFDNNWKLEGALNWSRVWGRTKSTFGIGGAGTGYARGIDPADPLISIRANAYDGGSVQVSGDLHASGPFILLGREHELVVGADARRNKAKSYDVPLSQDLYNPLYNYVGNPFQWNHDLVPKLDVLPATGYSTTNTTQSGLYATARFSLNNALKLILGARYSRWETESASYSLPANARARSSGYEVNGEVTPFAGLVRDLNEKWTTYASYADIFTPQNAINRDGDLLKPIIGANYELGIKGELADGALNTSFAIFRIEQKSRAQNDMDGPSPRPVSGSFYCSIESGKVRSQGFEAELSGRVAKGLDLFAGYTFNTTKYLEDNANQGKVFNTFTPKRILRLWANQRFSGDWHRLSVGGGITAMSEAYSQNGNLRIAQGGYSLVNLAAAYRINDRLSLALNVDNVFDRIYYSRIGSLVNGNIYGEPRKFTLTLRASY